jgi:hypothetical protein
MMMTMTTTTTKTTAMTTTTTTTARTTTTTATTTRLLLGPKRFGLLGQRVARFVQLAPRLLYRCGLARAFAPQLLEKGKEKASPPH